MVTNPHSKILPSKPFNLQALPVELFYQVVSFLPRYDKFSLNITCKAFNDLVPVDRVDNAQLLDDYFDSDNNSHEDTWSLRSYWDMELYLEYMDKLFTPGNIFHDKGVELCLRCLKVRSNDEFPMKDYKLDGRSVCKGCVALLLREGMPPGHHHQYNKDSFYSCRGCGGVQAEDKMFEHVLHHDIFSTREYERLCESCHLDLCDVSYCYGWTKEYCDERPDHFVGEDECSSDCDCDCPDCNDTWMMLEEGDAFRHTSEESSEVVESFFDDQDLDAVFTEEVGEDIPAALLIDEDSDLAKFIAEAIEDEDIAQIVKL